MDLPTNSLAIGMMPGHHDRMGTAVRPIVDEVSHAIIEQLQEDGRRPYAAIGKAVGLSEAAVRQRVQRLQDSGVMQIVAVTDPMLVGSSQAAMVGITVDGDLEPVADALAQLPSVTYLVLCAGGFDLLAEIVVQDNAHLLSVTNDGIRCIPGVRRVEVFTYLNIRKQTYMWGNR